MAVNRSPIMKRCRALGLSPAVLGYNKTSNRNPGGGRNKKVSKYGMQLKEKQKLKFIYGVLEKQFYHYYEMAEKKEGITGENLLRILECRLDNIIWRMGMANSRREARQLVTHGHFTLNGRKANIPSMLVKVGDVIVVKEKFRETVLCKNLIEALPGKLAPKWLEVDKTNLTAKVIAMPARDDIDYEVNEQAIVEFYSK
ncbi:MAG: 30S ribosomal protein S4 [Clostridia bacterium]|nr:30S ribosomal protein S4 [Clostridia bacterium]